MEKYNRVWPTKGVGVPSEFCGLAVDLSRAGDRTLNPAGSRLPVETPSQRYSAAVHEERGVVLFVGSNLLKYVSYNST